MSRALGVLASVVVGMSLIIASPAAAVGLANDRPREVGAATPETSPSPGLDDACPTCIRPRRA